MTSRTDSNDAGVCVVRTLPTAAVVNKKKKEEQGHSRPLEVESMADAREHRMADEQTSGGWSADCNDESRGFGDTVAKLTHALGIEQCTGCRARQALFNAWLPYSGQSSSE